MPAHRSPVPDPEILEMPAQKMAAVYARGAPEVVFRQVLPDLYGSVQTLNFELVKDGRPSFEIGALRARYPDAHLLPVGEWTHVFGLPVPDDITAIPRRVGGPEVKIEIWEYGTVAQIQHTVDSHETASIERLHFFIDEMNYRIVGVLEDEYTAAPDGTLSRTITRYRVERRYKIEFDAGERGRP